MSVLYATTMVADIVMLGYLQTDEDTNTLELSINHPVLDWYDKDCLTTGKRES